MPRGKQRGEGILVGSYTEARLETLSSTAYFTPSCLSCARCPCLVTISTSEGKCREVEREAHTKGWKGWKRKQVKWQCVCNLGRESWECLFMFQKYVEYCSRDANQLFSCLLRINQKEMASIIVMVNLDLKGNWEIFKGHLKLVRHAMHLWWLRYRSENCISGYR